MKIYTPQYDVTIKPLTKKTDLQIRFPFGCDQITFKHDKLSVL